MTITSRPSGLTSNEVRRRLVEHGPNLAVPRQVRPKVWHWLTRALSDPMTLLLLVAAPTYLALGDAASAAIALGAIIPLAATGFVLETRAERALDELSRMNAPHARVERDGRMVEIPAEGVVPGDLLELREGDVIAADGRIVDVAQLAVDESPLTGESSVVDKAVRGPASATRVFMGTTVLSGRALVVVEQTGASTEYGRVGALLVDATPPRTPLQHVVRRLVVRLGMVATGFCMAVAGVELLRGSGWGAALLAGVSLAIATVPEEFPLVYTLYLALGARRLAREHALVRRLAAVETLGGTTVICTDKTGTLTLGHVAVGALVTADGTRHGGEGCEGDGDGEVDALLRAAVLASEPRPFDPLDRAIVAAAREHDVDVDALHAQTLVRDYAFDPTRRCLTHIWSDGAGPFVVASKGAAEGLLGRVSCDPGARAALEEMLAVLASEGMRVIAVAAGHVGRSTDRDHDERALRIVGLIGLTDPLRPGVSDAVRECTDAGVRVVMVTGDHPATARAVADGIGLPRGDNRVATGTEMDAADGPALAALARETAIFARSRPEQKHHLVEALQRNGQVVAMTGDGINDAPALRQADIGLAMGLRGTEVAREAATMVLLDDNFATIVVAIREGRRIFDNLRAAFAYLVAYHVPLLAAALLIPLLGEPLLLLPIHLILLQIIGHPTAALAFEGDQPVADVMQRPPRSARASLLSRRTLLRSVGVGAGVAVGVIGAYVLRRDAGASAVDARAFAFAVLLVAEILVVFVVRAGDEPFWRVGTRGNRSLLGVTAASIAMAAMVFLVPPLRELLKLGTLDAAQAAAAIGVAIVAVVVPSVARRVRSGGW
jgi:Ca2+-transporting ATPase